MNDVTLLAILRDPANAAEILATAQSPEGKRILEGDPDEPERGREHGLSEGSDRSAT